MSRVQVLYDFTGEPNSSELTINVGEILTVTNTEVGEGWWEGSNARGQRGLFPAAYVEVLPNNPGPPKIPVPPLQQPPQQQPQVQQQQQQQQQQGPRYDQTADDWGDQPDDWEDDWDDDNDTYSEIGPASGNNAGGGGNAVSSQNGNFHSNRYNANAILPLPPVGTNDGDTTSLASTAVGGTRRTTSSSKIFSKTGDAYLMGLSVPSVSESDRVQILQVDSGIMWKPLRDGYTVVVDSPKKEKKFNGLKSFIAYQLTPSFNNIPVSRRYKHFDWLHERLVDKFCLIPIPPLPDKQISGRYDEEFVEHRRVQLQEFVDWMCRHPVLSTCGVWMHFLTCTDEKKWKTGKRTAEKDPLVGTTFCAAIFPPDKTLLQSQVEPQVDSCTLFVPQMNTAVKTLAQICSDETKKFQVQWRQDYLRIGDGLSELARALELDERRQVTQVSLSNSVGQAAGIFINIGQMFADQPKHDFIPFSDRLHIYRGLLNSFPDALNEYKNAVQKRKDCERLAAEQKMDNSQLAEVNRRVDVISYGLLAEMTHFRQERDTHLKDTLRSFIGAQVDFYKNIVRRLEQAQSHF
ncbi:sorting nexin lst-4 [Toxorhynchites rutilus septentrionalis]|uniref:sorting nexin lst-4 n=1 Tax=Toxorhynchites rutilus septentrionalis TaxID=329112 RepID=UPI0024790648|nr:sorting nexin lst-4 [Toxorhynchites rutilus septentrionalis]XP_055624007.1 sorting nexin lst-4 [Toxorhynchites rutilus septentrionalis]XP_055624009.1 sorting nexin lst-4 [Toxorhynchites rutilus septentrionalis]